jgi:Tol biopolymer transport system component
VFEAGKTIGGFRVLSRLGAGGMGEVWLATDQKLGREVAIKVLPADVADDPERLGRFEREAKLLASLNHPNIAHLYGLESIASAPETTTDAGADADAGVTTFLVMELVDGEDLSDRITRGAIPVDEAIPIALQIAEALETAHERGIVHRDLKPANIKIRPDGTVKVLDFGLAKAWDTEDSDTGLSMSPTLTQHATAAGLILGTAGYMAPEQAAGTAADRRADIWAFGVVLWEMLTGCRMFDGETVSHVLASVLKDEPQLAALPADTPQAVTDLIGRCLRKNPRTRMQAIGDVRIVLEEVLADPGSSAPAAGGPPAEQPSVVKRLVPWTAAAVLALTAATAFVLRGAGPQTMIKATIPPPDGMAFDLRAASPGPAAVSPDGTRIAFTAIDEDSETRIFVRRLDAGTAVALSGTEGAQYPFWSPDSRWLGFFTQPDDVLRKIDTSGGPPITLCQAANGKGGSWSPDGVIVFAANASAGLSRVSAAGGEPVEITTLNGERHNSHRLPWFLPDGRRFLFVARGVTGDESAVMVGSLDGGEPVEVLRNQSQAAYASGRLLFVRDRTLMAQDFDPDEAVTTAEALPLAEDVLVIPGAALAVFGVSNSGVLTFQTGSSVTETTLEWRSRDGETVGVLGEPGLYRLARLSPDGRHAAVQLIDVETGTQDIWIYEVARNIRTRFTFDPLADVNPVWSPDGETVFFASNRDGDFAIYSKPLSGVGEVGRVASFGGAAFPDSLSPDGRRLVALVAGDGTGADMHLVELDNDNATSVFRRTDFNEGGGVISPDGRWIAYHSDESGDFEVYVTTFPEAGRRWQISSGHGVYPEWRRDGRQIVYSDYTGTLIAVGVDGGRDTFDVGAAETLFTIESPDQGGAYSSLAPDGERFLVVPGVTQQADTLLNLVINWPAQLEDRR